MNKPPLPEGFRLLKADEIVQETDLSRRRTAYASNEFVRKLEIRAILAEQKAQTLRAALEGIVSIGKRDMTNSKYDEYFEAAREALKTP